jgi:hypothetical protein
MSYPKEIQNWEVLLTLIITKEFESVELHKFYF